MTKTVLFLFFLYLIQSCGSSTNDNNEETPVIGTPGLSSCPQTTPFSEDAIETATLGQFSDMKATSEEDTYLLTALTALTGNNLELIKTYNSLDDYKKAPQNIIIRGAIVKNLTEEKITKLLEVFKQNRCLVLESATENQLTCLEAKLNIDLNPKEELRSRQTKACNSFLDGNEHNSVTFCKKYKTDSLPVKNFVSLPRNESSETSNIRTNASYLTNKDCVEYQLIYKAMSESNQDDPSLSLNSTAVTNCTDLRTSLCLDTPSIATKNYTTTTVTKGMIDFVEGGSNPVSLYPSLTIYRTTTFIGEDGSNKCDDTYCDIYLFRISADINSKLASGSADFGGIINIAEGGTPTWSSTSPFGDYAHYSGQIQKFCSLQNMAMGGFLKNFTTTTTIETPGYENGGFNPQSDPNQIYSASGSSSTNSSFTVGGSAGVSGDTPSASVTASYTQGTSDSSGTTTTTNLMSLSGTQDCNTDDSSTTPNECTSIETTATITAADISSHLDPNFTSDGSSLSGYGFDSFPNLFDTTNKSYPSFKDGVAPGVVHTGDITFDSYFYIIKPKTVINSQNPNDLVESFTLGFNLSYYFFYTDRNPANSDDWGLCYNSLESKSDTFSWDHTYNLSYSVLPKLDDTESFQSSYFDYTLGDNGGYKTITSSLLETLKDNTDYDSGCTSDRDDDELQRELLVPTISGFAPPSLPTKKDGTLATIDSEVECRLTCYLSEKCVWSRWGYQDSDSSTDSYCEHSEATCGLVRLNADQATCTSSDHFSYFFNQNLVTETSTSGSTEALKTPIQIVSSYTPSAGENAYAYYENGCP